MTGWQPRFVPEQDLKELNLVLSPGRVATTSIHEWLNQSGVKTFKLHMTQRHAVNDRLTELRTKKHPVPAFLKQSSHILGRAINEADPVRIVLPVREPFSRNLSAFRRFMATGYRLSVPEDFTDDSLRVLFETEVPPDRLDTWMNRNLFPILPQHILENRISDSKPIARFRHGRFRILVMRAELGDTRKCKVLSRFFGKKVTEGKRVETGVNHNEAIPEKLQRALSRLKGNVSQEYRDALRASQYARLFYPELAGLPAPRQGADPARQPMQKPRPTA